MAFILIVLIAGALGGHLTMKGRLNIGMSRAEKQTWSFPHAASITSHDHAEHQDALIRTCALVVRTRFQGQ